MILQDKEVKTKLSIKRGSTKKREKSRWVCFKEINQMTITDKSRLDMIDAFLYNLDDDIDEYVELEDGCFVETTPRRKSIFEDALRSETPPRRRSILDDVFKSGT